MKAKQYPDLKTFLSYVDDYPNDETNYYAKAYEKLFVQNNRFCWNWSAAFFGFFWLIYRRMYFYAVVYFWVINEVSYFLEKIFTFNLLMSKIPLKEQLAITQAANAWIALILLFITFIIFGLFGSKIYCKWVIDNIDRGITRPAKKTDLISIIVTAITIPVLFLLYFIIPQDFIFSYFILLTKFKAIIITPYLMVRHYLYYRKKQNYAYI